MGDVIDVLDFGVDGIEPPACIGGEFVFADDHVVVAGFLWVEEDENGIAVVVEVLDGFVSEVGFDAGAVERVGIGGVGDVCAGGEDHGQFMVERNDGGLGFGESATGAEGNEDAGILGFVNSVAVGVGDAAVGVEEGSIQINSEHAVLHGG